MLTAQRALDVLLAGTGLNVHPIATAPSLSLRGTETGTRSGGLSRLFGDVAADGPAPTLRHAGTPSRQLPGRDEVLDRSIRRSRKPGAVEFDRRSRRDGRIPGALKTMTVARPPAALLQPVIMVIRPRASSETGDCAGGVHVP